MTLKNKLARFKKYIASTGDNEIQDYKNEKTKQQEIVELTSEDKQVYIPYMEEWSAIQATPFYFDNHYSMIREVSYPLDSLHGLHRFSELYDVIELWEDRSIEHPLAFSKEEPSRMIFFDTETTGLGGGVGNTIFLIGYAQVLADKVVVKQHFLPSPSAEVALF